MILELLIVCNTIVVITWLVTRVLVARSEAQAALHKRMALLRRTRGGKRSTDDEDNEAGGSIVEAILEELGVPPSMAMPVIQGYISQMLRRKPPKEGEEAI